MHRIPAHEQQIGGDGNIYVGEDKTLQWRILDAPEDEGGVAVNVTGWVCQFVVRTHDAADYAALIDKTSTIVGTFNADPAVNTQYVQVVLTDDDLALVPDWYRYSIKRTDAGHEDILRAGPFVVELATQV